MKRTVKLLPLAFLVGMACIVFANPEPPKSGYQPKLAKASDEAQKNIARFKKSYESLSVSVWAAEPMVTHPVAIAFDEHGRCYVAETFRHSRGTTDNRSHMNWLDDELAARTVEDRVKIYQKDAGKNFLKIYESEKERVRLLQDTNGDGTADRSTVFDDEYGKAADGLGAGVLARKGNVYFTCIPDLWLLEDPKNTGYRTARKSLSSGYGVHTAFIGHDLHGLRIGPDKKLYFTVGDRGLNVTSKEGKRLFNPDSGAVLRCNLDGSDLEIYATGLRNPQELAFDNYGNLITVDNNSDSGDQARLIDLVQGGDSGWRIGYQYGSGMHDSTVKQGNRGPWNYEKLWVPNQADHPAYLLPPRKNFTSGPSGLTYYPGIGLDSKYENHFFLSEFRGGSGNSGVWAFQLKPQGATFELARSEQFLWNTLTTDCEFGPDSNLYVADWSEGWNTSGKGRIYKVSDEKAQSNPAVQEAQNYLKDGLEQMEFAKLIKLLSHPHRDVRQEAHFELALRGFRSLPHLEKYLDEKPTALGAVHALWAVAMIAKNVNAAQELLEKSLKQPDNQVRAAAIKAYGELPTASHQILMNFLSDSHPRVQLNAALGLGNLSPDSRNSAALKRALFDLIAKNNNQDTYIRHGGIIALASQVDTTELAKAKSEPDPAIRLAVVAALRKKNSVLQLNGTSVDDEKIAQNSAAIQGFLTDVDSKVVAEAARAIIDEEPKLSNLEGLAKILSNPTLPPVVIYRALNANYILGQPANANALVDFAANSPQPPYLRKAALELLANWAKPPRRDFVDGSTQALPSRPADSAVNAIKSQLGKLFGANEEIRKQAATTASKLGIKEVVPFLTAIALDKKAPDVERSEALNALSSLKDPQLAVTLDQTLKADQPLVRATSRTIIADLDQKRTKSMIEDGFHSNSVVEKQAALKTLTKWNRPEADAAKTALMKLLLDNQQPAELHLDILEAASSSKSNEVKQLLAQYEKKRNPNDHLSAWRETLAGGDAERGKALFINNSAVQCQRCHIVGGIGGEVGPVLDGIAVEKNAEYLLEAIAVPNKQIAKGYDSVLITTLDGKSVSGILRPSQKSGEINLITPEGKMIVIDKENVESSRPTKSAMPEDIIQKLTKRELRDLVAYLQTLKTPPPK
ncbi:MAG: HEAT repeat domain-containing protein [Zavarzinella sp.]